MHQGHVAVGGPPAHGPAFLQQSDPAKAFGELGQAHREGVYVVFVVAAQAVDLVDGAIHHDPTTGGFLVGNPGSYLLCA